MGLFDFMKGVGKQVFANDAEAAGKIKAEIEKDNPGIQDPDKVFPGQKIRLPQNAA